MLVFSALTERETAQTSLPQLSWRLTYRCVAIFQQNRSERDQLGKV